MTDTGILSPSEAARRLGVRTAIVIEAMYERRLPRVRLEDGTLGIPARRSISSSRRWRPAPEEHRVRGRRAAQWRATPTPSTSTVTTEPSG